MRCIRFLGGLPAALWIALYLQGGFDSALADVVIIDSADTMRVEIRDSSIAEVLDAFNVTFDTRYREMLDQDRLISRTYLGSSSQVIWQLLERYDYVGANAASGRLEILWIKRSVRSPAREQVSASIIERPNSAVLTQTVRRAPPPWRRSLDKRMIKHGPPEYTVASVGLFRNHCRRSPVCRAVFRRY